MSPTIIARTVVIGDSARLVACGELDRDNQEQISAAVRRELAAGRNVITVDLRDVTFLDAGALRTLVACRDLAVGAGRRMPVINATGLVALVLELTTDLVPPPASSPRTAVAPRPPPAEMERAAELAATSASLIDRARGLVIETHRIINTIGG
jgi:anti-anti-sigma factor